MRQIRKTMFMLAAVAGFAALPALASPIPFNFNAGLGDLGAGPTTFTSGAFSISANGYVGSTANNLFEKNSGGDEQGLGLKGTNDSEINPGQSIVFNLTNLANAGLTSGTFTLGSLQTGEDAEVCVTSSSNPGSAASGTCQAGLIDNLGGSVGTVVVNWSKTDSFVEFITDPHQSSSTGNYLVDGLDVNNSTVPEPPSVILLGTALLGLACVTRRRFVHAG